MSEDQNVSTIHKGNVGAAYSMGVAMKMIEEPVYAMHFEAIGMRIQELVNTCHIAACASGWYVDRVTMQPITLNFGERIALKHSELSEALEGHRRGLMSDKIPEFTAVEEEFADTFIRICDTAGGMKLRLGEAIMAKLKYNRTRTDHKLDERVKGGGKAY